MTLFERLKGTDNKVKRCIAFLLFLMILLTSTIIPVKRAKAVVPVLVGVGIVALVTAGLVACGIAVDAADDGSDVTTALGYTMQYVRQKMREAKVTELEAGLMVATGAINLAGQAWQWIKQAAANIYNNASYFQAASNAIQIGNFNAAGTCKYISADNLYYCSPNVYHHYFYTSSSSASRNDFKFLINHLDGVVLSQTSSSYLIYLISESPLSEGNHTVYNYLGKNYYYLSIVADGKYLTFGSSDVYLQSSLNVYASMETVIKAYLNVSDAGTGISAQTNQSASIAFDGAKDYFDGVKDAVTGGSVSADLSTDQQRRLMLGYDVESSKDLINVGQIVQEYGSVANWLAGIRAGTANAYQDLINIGCQPYVNVDAQGRLVTVDKDGYIIDSTGTRVGTGIKVGDGSIAGNPAIPVGDVVSVPLDDVGSIPKVKTDTATGDITVDIDKTLDIPASDTIDKPTSEAGNKKYQFAGVTDFFPFCLPFDAYDFLSTFSASPVAPEFEFPASFYTDIFGGKNPEGKHYQVNGKNLVAINGDKVIISLAPFDTIAKIFRVLVLLFFIMMLIWFAYRLIHGGD